MLDSHLIAHTRPKANEANILLNGTQRVTVLTEQLFRIEFDPECHFCDEATQAVWFRDAAPVKFKVAKEDNGLRVVTAKASLFLGSTIDDSYVCLGGRNIPLNNAENLHGTYRTLDQCNGDENFSSVYHGPQTNPSRVTLDLGVIAKNGVAVYDDTASLILGQDGMVCARADDSLDCYVFAYGHDYRKAIQGLYMICGQTPLIPRYALGNWWSRYYNYSEKEYIHLLDRFASQDIPLTVATVDMDWHWSDTLEQRKQIKTDENTSVPGGNLGWTGYSWNTDLFPDYKRFLKKIKERNLHTTLNLHPADGVRYFEDCYPEMANAMGIDPSTKRSVDFDMTDARFINAYFNILHKPYEHDGVDFWWIDWQQGSQSKLPGLDPLWALNHYHTLDNAKEHMPLILSRYCGIGSHRYPLGFSGDTHITWKTLKYLSYFTSTATNVGYTWWSHDIGGHMYGEKNDELYVRFIQNGVFSPINRLHGSDERIATKEPLVYMNGTGLIAQEYLRLRHKMIPFLYSASYETAENGIALIEPMYYAYPDEEKAYHLPQQYLFGGQLMIATITEPGDANKLVATEVWLPEGHWTDIFTGDEYDGGRSIEMVRWLDSMPTLAHEGSIFVLDGRSHTNLCDNPDRLTVQVYNGNGSYTLHEDRDGVRADTLFTATHVGQEQTLCINIPESTGSVDRRDFRLEFRNILVGNVKVEKNGKEDNADWDDNDYVSVCITDAKPGDTYTVTVTEEPRDAREWRNQRLLYSLQRIEAKKPYKNHLYFSLLNMNDKDCHTAIRMSAFSENAIKRLLEQL